MQKLISKCHGPNCETEIYKEDSGGYVISYDGKGKRLNNVLYYDFEVNLELARYISGINYINKRFLEAIIEHL